MLQDPLVWWGLLNVIVIASVCWLVERRTQEREEECEPFEVL